MNSTTETFSLGGIIAGRRDTIPSVPIPSDPIPSDPIHPALMLVVGVGSEYSRIMVPPTVWPAAHELLEIGRYLAVSGLTDSYPFIYGSQQVATEVRPINTNH